MWDRLEVETLAREGTGILRYIRTQAENLAGMAQEQDLAGNRVPVVNTSLLGSETCEALLERHPEAEFAATYWEGDGRRHWSLRSRADGDFDVSQIALKLGGGWHPHAAGFTEEPVRWEPMNPADWEFQPARSRFSWNGRSAPVVRRPAEIYVAFDKHRRGSRGEGALTTGRNR